MSARISALRRALVISAALFVLLLTFLSLQMLRGRDPSVRTAQVHTSAPASAPKDEKGSVLGSIVSLAVGVISDDGGGSSVKTQTS